MTSTAHDCGGARRLSGAAAATEAEEAATAVARLARARTGSWAGAGAGLGRFSGRGRGGSVLSSSSIPAAAAIFAWFVVFIFTSSTPAAAAIVRVFMASSPFIFIFVANTALHEIKQIKISSREGGRTLEQKFSLQVGALGRQPKGGRGVVVPASGPLSVRK